MLIGYDDLVTDCLGDVRFRAPEVIQGKPYAFMADMWSIGVIMYQMLAGSLPYDHPNYELNAKGQPVNGHTIEERVIYREPNYGLIASRGHTQNSIDLLRKLLERDTV